MAVRGRRRADRRVEIRDGRHLAVVADGAIVVAQPRAVEVLEPNTGAISRAAAKSLTRA